MGAKLIACLAVVTLSVVSGGASTAEPNQDSVAEFNELSKQVAELSETIMNAQPDLDAKMAVLGEADQRNSENLAHLQATEAQLATHQRAVDEYATAVYMGGRTDIMSAVLTARSPADLIDQLVTQRVLNTEMTEQMNGLRQANREAQDLAAASQRSAAEAKAAVDAAVAVRDDLQNKRAELRKQLAAVNATYAQLPPAQQAELSLPPTAAIAAALGPIAPVPTVGFGGLTANARAVADYVMATFPGIQSIGGVRADPLPDHPSGRAIDIMIGSNMALGDAINADLQGQMGRFNINYTMWRVAYHFDHVHVSVFG